MYLSGVGGNFPVEGIGVVGWTIEDDSGMVRVKINDSYYYSQAPLRPLVLNSGHNIILTARAQFSG